MKKKNPGPNPAQRWPPYPQYEIPQGHERVWRYMDFTKFIWLLDKSALYFPRVSTVLNDAWEGSYPVQDSARNVAQNEREIAEYVKWRIDLRDRYYVSCWHLSEYESAAMWSLYRKADIGVAIQTDYQRLEESISEESLFDFIYLGKVRYIDYETEKFRKPIYQYGDLTALFHKRKSFEHEKELRLVTSNLHQLDSSDEKHLEKVPGLSIRVDLEKLIQNVYVSPAAPTWLRELLESVLGKYGLPHVPVHHTDLDRDPIY